jgi:hypothetical protein
VHGVGTVTSHLAFPRQRFITAPWDMWGPSQSWLQFLKRRDAAHDYDELRGTLRLLMLVSPIF